MWTSVYHSEEQLSSFKVHQPILVVRAMSSLTTTPAKVFLKFRRLKEKERFLSLAALPTWSQSQEDFQKLPRPMLGLRNVLIKNLQHPASLRS